MITFSVAGYFGLLYIGGLFRFVADPTDSYTGVTLYCAGSSAAIMGAVLVPFLIQRKRYRSIEWTYAVTDLWSQTGLNYVMRGVRGI
ncbi:MAG TPA: hypothetical protein DCR93_00025 [Cytophagales bacterium]|nr:hypothetical protein [Cytophagales bacterium]HAP57959.1 hypothetical protein [Cytophagales bacterium]